MTELTLAEFRRKLREAVDRCADNHEALKVLRRDGADFVVLSAEDWASVEETLRLNQTPGLAKSILAANAEPLEAGTPLENLDW